MRPDEGGIISPLVRAHFATLIPRCKSELVVWSLKGRCLSRTPQVCVCARSDAYLHLTTEGPSCGLLLISCL